MSVNRAVMRRKPLQRGAKKLKVRLTHETTTNKIATPAGDIRYYRFVNHACQNTSGGIYGGQREGKG
jgi:hypothetical protein